ncbi:major facilitator superfamily domain-containing protein [Hyaloraphidium curvatum]|nr:major facilitator superfamily domain-containing protein [Hyaloraphidium curvatum]
MRFLYAKAIYALLFTGWCSAGPYFTLVWKNVLGFDEEQIGVLSSLQPIIAFLCVPLWTSIADRTGRYRSILIFQVIMMGTFLNLMFLKPTYPVMVGMYIAYSLCMVAVNPLTDSLVLGMLGEESDKYGQQRVFGTLACGTTSFLVSLLVSHTQNLHLPFYVRAVAVCGVCALLWRVPNYWKRQSPPSEATKEAAARPAAVLAKHRPSLASTDSSMFSVIDPSLMAASPSQGTSPSSPGTADPNLKPGGDLRMAMLKKSLDGRTSAVSSPRLVAAPPAIKELAPASAPPPGGWGWLLNVNVFGFLFAMFCIGMTLVVISTFQWLFLLSLGAPTTLLGITSLASITTEAPMFYFSKHILKRLGIPGTIMLSQAAMSIRVFSYSFLTPGTVWGVLAIETLNGACFATAWAAGVKFVGQIAPVGREATSQGILNAIFSGLGPAVGCTVGGALYKQFGPHLMFRIMGAVNLAGLAMFAGIVWAKGPASMASAGKATGKGGGYYERLWEASESVRSLVDMVVLDPAVPPKKPPRTRSSHGSAQSVGLFAIGSEAGSRIGSTGSLHLKKADDAAGSSEKGSQKTVALSSGSSTFLVQRAQSATLGPQTSASGSTVGIDLAVIKSSRVSQAEAVAGSGTSIGIGPARDAQGRSDRNAMP